MTRPNVLVIDAGLGNIGSVVAAFQRLGCAYQRLTHPPSSNATSGFTHVVLPGVGTFLAGINALKRSGWDVWIKNDWCDLNRPFLGICLGMQLLATEGSEGSLQGSSSRGLNLIPGRVVRLNVGSDLVLPHVGWNSLHWQGTPSMLFNDLVEGGTCISFIVIIFNLKTLPMFWLLLIMEIVLLL